MEGAGLEPERRWSHGLFAYVRSGYAWAAGGYSRGRPHRDVRRHDGCHGADRGCVGGRRYSPLGHVLHQRGPRRRFRAGSAPFSGGTRRGQATQSRLRVIWAARPAVSGFCWTMARARRWTRPRDAISLRRTTDRSPGWPRVSRSDDSASSARWTSATV